MQNREHSSASVTRRDLESAWRVGCEMARERYEMARRRYRKLLEEKPEGPIPRHDDPLALARDAETEALAEYTRILRIFTELTVRGRIPDEQLGAKANGGRG